MNIVQMNTLRRSLEREGVSREIGLISEAIINFYAAHVNSLLYPYDHPLVSDSLKNSYHCLQKAFQKKSVITLYADEDGVTVEKEALAGDLLVFKNFASWLNSNHIQSLSFVNDLTRRELINFHKIISLKKSTEDELCKTMLEKSITSITVRHTESVRDTFLETSTFSNKPNEELIKDYMSTMFFAESDETQTLAASAASETFLLRNTFDGKPSGEYIGIRLDEATIEPAVPDGSDSAADVYKGKTAEGALFERCIEELLERRISEDELKVVRSIPPKQMAHLLNAMFSLGSPSEGAIMRITEAYFGEDYNAQCAEAVDRCAIFFEGLRPSLRPAFRMIASLAGLEDLGIAEETPIIGGEKKEEIPLSLAAGRSAAYIDAPHSPLVRRMLKQSDFIFDFIADGKAVFHDIELRDESVFFFNEDHLAQFKDGVFLDRLSSELDASEAAHSKSFALLMEECSDDMIWNSFFQIMIELLLTDSLDGDTFQQLTGKLTPLVGQVLEKGELDKVLEVFNSLKTQELQGKVGSQATAMARNIFSSDQFIEKMVESLRWHGRKRRVTAGKLTDSLKSYLVPYLLDALSEETETSRRKFIITLLAQAGSDVLPHIVRRLRDSRWYVLRNMILLLRECHGRSQSSEIRAFLQHEVPLVQLEALRTLLSFQDPSAEAHVVKFLESGNEQLQKGAAGLAGTHRIKKAVSHLVKMIDEKDLLGKNVTIKRTIVRALGRIGDSRVISHLLSLYRTTSLAHRVNYEKLRVDIFRTLHNYPVESVKPLIDCGMQSSNKEIVAVSKKLLHHYNVSRERQRL